MTNTSLSAIAYLRVRRWEIDTESQRGEKHFENEVKKLTKNKKNYANGA